MIRFSIIVPTLGRPSLERMLESIRAQPLGGGDEVIVVGDYLDDALICRVRKFDNRFWMAGLPSVAPYLYGNPQRNFGLTLCRGDYINYQDEDDVMAPGILAVMRANCEAQPGKIFIYQMRWPDGHLNPGYPPRDLAGGQCFVWPNIPGRMGKFGHRYAGDQNFLVSSFVGGGCGQECVASAQAEQIYEYAGQCLDAVANAGMLGQSDLLAGLNALLQGGQQHMQQLADQDPSAQGGLTNLTKALNEDISAASSIPATAPKPLDVSQAQTLFPGTSGWYATSASAGAQLALSYLQSLASAQASTTNRLAFGGLDLLGVVFLRIALRLCASVVKQSFPLAMEQTIALHPENKAGVIYRPEVITEYAGCHEKR